MIYGEPVTAYGVFDFFGKGKITINEIIKNRTILKITEGLYTQADIMSWLYRDSIFEKDLNSTIDFY